MNDKDKPESIRFAHHRASNFASIYANGVIVTHIEELKMFNITFYEDVVGVNGETVSTDKKGESVVTFEKDDLFLHKEDKVRVSMNTESMRALYLLLKKRFADGDKVE